MNILSVSDRLTRNAGGMFEGMVRLNLELSRLPGMTIRVCGLDDEFIGADLPAWAPLPVKVFQPWGPGQFQYAPGFRRHLLEADVDVVHRHGLWTYPSVAVCAWRRKYRRPYLVSPQGMLDPWAVKNSAWKKWLALVCYERRHLENAACLHAVSESEARSMRRLGLKNPICVIPNGTTLPSLSDHGPEPGDVSLFHPQARGRKIVLYLGRIHPKKNLANLLRAWKGLLVSQPGLADSWFLVIAGWDQGGHESELKKMAAESGLGDSVCFPGPQFGEAKSACFRDCDAFILPSVSEGLPLAVLEAWSYAKPVLMTSQCNLPEGFAAQAAVRLDPDAESIARGLASLAAMSLEDRRRMGQRGLDLVRARFLWPRIALQMQSVYGWVLGQGARPECMFQG